MLNNPPLLPGDRHAIVDGYSLSYEPLYGIDNKDGLQFAWQCMTLNTADFDELVAVSSQPLPPDIDTDCDEISTEILPGRRQLKVGGGVTAVGYVFKVRNALCEREQRVKHTHTHTHTHTHC